MEYYQIEQIHIVGVPDRQEKGTKNIFKEIMSEKFPSPRKEMEIQSKMPNGYQMERIQTKLHQDTL
jgi:hypothetical protein